MRRLAYSICCGAGTVRSAAISPLKSAAEVPSVNSSRTQMVGENQYSETDATSEHLSACFPGPAVNLWVVGSSPKRGPF